MPIAAVSAANRIVSSYDGTMKVVQLASGRPPMFIGYSITDAQYCSAKPVAMPVRPPASTSFGSTRARLVDDVVQLFDRHGRVGLDPA